MALFDSTPPDTEAVTLGAQRIRDMKTLLNATLGLIFSSGTPTWVSNIIPGVSLVNASVTSTQIAAGGVAAANLAPGAVSAAASVADAYWYGAATYSAPNYSVTLSPAPAALVPGMMVRVYSPAANAGGGTGLSVNGLGTALIYFGPGSPATGSPIASLTQTGNIATVTTASAHGLSTSNTVSVRGAAQAPYNVTSASITVTSTTTFTYVITGSPVSPATVLATPAILKVNGQTLAAGDIPLNQMFTVTFDGTNWQITSLTGLLVDAGSSNYAGLAKAWVEFDGTPCQSYNGPNAMTLTYNTSTRVFTASSGIPGGLTAGSAVSLYSSGTLPGGLAAATVYYIGNIVGSSFQLFATSANAVSNTSPLGTSGAGSGTHNLLYVLIKASYNITAVIPVNCPLYANQMTAPQFNAYDVYFTTPPASAAVAVVGSARLNASSSIFAMHLGVDPSDSGLTTCKRINLNGVGWAGGLYPAPSPETSVSFHWN